MNELFLDLSFHKFYRFVIYINGQKEITDVTTNDNRWHHILVTWVSVDGSWQIYKDGQIAQQGTNLATGTTIEGKEETLCCSYRKNGLVMYICY